MKLNLFRCIIIGLFIISYAYPQDTLIVKSGKAYVGKFVANTGSHIRFFPDTTALYPQMISKNNVRKVVLGNGTIIFDSEKDISTIVHNKKSKTKKKFLNIGTDINHETEMENDINTESNLDQRAVIALEKIATAQTYFMYLSIVSIILSFVLIASSG